MAETTETIHLEKENELLFTTNRPGDIFTIRLVTGSAEIFGSKLYIDHDYNFSYFSSVSIFTSHGCTLQLKKQGSSHSRYRIKSSWQMPQMRDVHKQLQRMRTSGDEDKDRPITLVVGPTDSGKSTLCRYLLNRATRQGNSPLFLDLDVGQNSLSMAGTLGVMPVFRPSDFYGRFDDQHLSVYYFGYKSPESNRALYKRLIEKIGKTMKTRLKRHPDISEILIDTCGWIDKGGYSLIKYIIDMLNVNTILVLSDGSLYSKLRYDFPESTTEIMYVDKFRGVVFRKKCVRRAIRDTRVSAYFYGSSNSQQPETMQVNFSDLQIFKANYDTRNTFEDVVPVSIEPSILYQVLAVSYAKEINKIPLSCIFCFISIVGLDMDSKVATILTREPHCFRQKFLLMGDIALTQTW